MSFKNLAPHVARTLLGLTFLVFGLNGFLQFLPAPPPEAAARPFLEGLMASGYMMAFIKGTEVAVGVLLLANRFVPLALAVLAPVMLNIVAFHLFLTPPRTLGMPLVLLGLHLSLAWTHRASYAQMLRARPTRQASLHDVAVGSFARAS
ncbi:MAG: DoxX family protein [Myxococcaceae bacterium]|nr:DoxX family protein [Myxococcaceae bacterium]MCI0670369.1 DoxX family protein [Myxococcaceae bacterium]